MGKFSAFCQLAALYYPAQPLLLMDYSRSVRWDLKIGACCPVGSSEHFEEIRNSSNWRLGGLIWRQGTPDWRLLPRPKVSRNRRNNKSVEDISDAWREDKVFPNFWSAHRQTGKTEATKSLQKPGNKISPNWTLLAASVAANSGSKKVLYFFSSLHANLFAQ